MTDEKIEKVEKVEAHTEHSLMCHHVHEHDTNEIKQLQKLLNVEETGVFDHTTHGALTEFQNNNEVEASGVLTLETAKKLKLK